MVFKMLSTSSEFQRDVPVERARNDHHTSGRIPFDYLLAADGSILTAVASEQITIARIEQCRAKGFSLAAIASSLEAEKLKTKTGCIWRASSVATNLNRRQFPAA